MNTVEEAYLTDEGMKLFGHIFPNGKIPIRSIIAYQSEIADYKGIVYMCDWRMLSDEQKEKLRRFMVEVRGIPEGDFGNLLESHHQCIPLRNEIVSIVGSDESHKYL